jgi:hypothetical protein
MLSIKYPGRTFNHWFSYVFGRLLAERNGLRLETAWDHPEYFTVSAPAPGHTMLNPITIKDDRGYEPWFEQDYRGRHVFLNGYFQYPQIYTPVRDKILSWLTLPPIESGHENDICIHLRLDDYIDCSKPRILHREWYASILAKPENAGKRVWAVVEKPKKQWEHEYIDKLRDLCKPAVVVLGDNPVNDWNLMRSFGTIICSNSSYCWWAAFLGSAKKVYTFTRWLVGATATLGKTDLQGWESVEGKYFYE